MNPDVIVLDAKYFCHRFYGRNLRSEINGKIVRTDIPYGALVGMISFFTQHKPKYGFILSWDGKSDDLVKRKIDERYKIHRTPQLKTFYKQIDLFKKIAKLLGIPQFIDEQWESDDIMGSLVKKRKDINWCIHTSDKDLYQIIAKNVKILKPIFKGRKRIYDFYGLEELKEELGVTPREYYLMKTIVGCKGDNVEGIKGIGEKTALKIVKGTKNIDEIIEKVKNSKKTTTKLILENKDILSNNKKLVSIKRTLKLIPQEEIKKVNVKKLEKFLEKIKFNSMLRKHNFQCLLEINKCGVNARKQQIWRDKNE